MSTRVYQFGLRGPIDGEPIVRAQLRAAREYRNDLVAIERGRRSALRAIDSADPAVVEAEEIVRVATTSTRKEAIAALRAARKAVREKAESDLAAILEREKSILRDARALTSCFWGSYLDIESAHRQARSAPLYEDDAVTPHNPRFVHARTDGLFEGQIGIQIQSSRPLQTGDVWRADDSRVRLERIQAFASAVDAHGRPRKSTLGKCGRKAVLALRVGSNGREPVWARWPIWVHREIPDAAMWKWVRVSVRLHGTHERWSCEITVDDPAPLARILDTSLDGAIAVEWSWDVLDEDAIRVATWADSRGERGDVILPGRIANGFAKADSIRAVRDMIANETRPKIAEAITRSGATAHWLARAGNTLPLWRSHTRMHDLLRHWTAVRCDLARDAYEMLLAWSDRDNHLWDYETGLRRSAMRQRIDIYRVLARQWSQAYRTVLLSDQDLSREARWGDEGTARFRAGCSDLRSALRNAFGPEDSVDSRWRDKPDDEDERSWCERTRDAWTSGGARGDGRFAERKEKTTNAWAARKAKKKPTPSANESAREAHSARAE